MTASRPPFGTYALPGVLEGLRAAASTFPINRVGRWAVSIVRKMCLVRRKEPVDVEVYPSVFARIYPSTNRCEKRIFAGPQFFDLPEREHLTSALEQSAPGQPFQFLDLGANVGMYSLWVVAESRRLGRSTRVVAVEPDKITGARLAANISMSDADKDVTIAACGVGGQAGRARMIEDGKNRGGNHIDIAADDGPEEDTTQVATILDICDAHGFDRVDALKIDVEGHDFAALEALFKSGRKELFPKWIQAEIGRGGEESELVRLCVENGYSMSARTKLNAIMQRAEMPSAVDERS